MPKHPGDIAITATDERRAAEITEAAARANGERFGDLLADVAAGDPDRHLAITALLARNLAMSLVITVGREDALRILESTRLDAAVAE